MWQERGEAQRPIVAEGQQECCRVFSRKQRKAVINGLEKLSERGTAGQPSIMEIFSPPRMSSQARKFGFDIAGVYDVVFNWDADDPEDVKRLWKDIREKKPYLITMSPPCEMLTTLQNLTPAHKRKDPQSYHRAVQQAVKYVELCVEVALFQLQHDRHFLFEAPLGARTWSIKTLAALLITEGVFFAVAHGCQFGVKDKVSGDPMKKAWGFATSSEVSACELDRQCDGQHRHQQVISSSGGESRSLHSQAYPPPLIRAVLRGASKQFAIVNFINEVAGFNVEELEQAAECLVNWKDIDEGDDDEELGSVEWDG